jgi:hypothetical protein
MNLIEAMTIVMAALLEDGSYSGGDDHDHSDRDSSVNGDPGHENGSREPKDRWIGEPKNRK